MYNAYIHTHTHTCIQASRKKMFFDSNGAPRIVPNSRGKKRRPGSKDVASAIRCNDSAFVSFLEGCLQVRAYLVWVRCVMAVCSQTHTYEVLCVCVCVYIYIYVYVYTVRCFMAVCTRTYTYEVLCPFWKAAVCESSLDRVMICIMIMHMHTHTHTHMYPHIHMSFAYFLDGCLQVRAYLAYVMICIMIIYIYICIHIYK